MKKRNRIHYQKHRRRPQRTVNEVSPCVLEELELTKKLSSIEEEVVIYVDGSHTRSIPKKYSYSFVVVVQNEIIHMQGGMGLNHLGLNNIAGELLAAKKAISYAIRQQKKKVTIFHDFNGTREIANTLKHRMRNDVSEEYRKYVETCRTKIEIDFYEVASHSGNYFNEMADFLAKKSLGLQVVEPILRVGS